MKFKNWNIFLVAIFIIVLSIVLLVGSIYKSTQAKESLDKQYSEIATSLSNKLDILIQEKKNSTLTIGLTLAQNPKFKKAIQNKEDLHEILAKFSQNLSKNTDFKNVWIQLVDEKGIVISKSWSKEIGNSLKNTRLDLKKMLNNPKIQASISMGSDDLSFKAMIPYFDEENRYVGFLEVITHFNSIANKMKSEDVETVVLVDKSYKNQIANPFRKKFIGDYCVSNKNAKTELMEYIKEQGVEKIVAYKQKYTLPKNEKYFRVNYTLFGLDEQPMAYILMFKKVQNINVDAIKNRGLAIDVLMMFIIVSVAFLLLLLVKKDQLIATNEKNTIKYLLVFFLAFVAFVFAFYLLLLSYVKHEKKIFLKTYNKNIEKDYNIINEKFEVIAETMFETTLNNPKVLKLIKKAYTQKKDLAREELYELLKAKYEYFKHYDVKQLHFHLKNNESFLRFHRPQKYGDNLTDIRATVEWVNLNQEKIKGFEEGRIYNGFRYVFPLSYTNSENEVEHLGSVEVSFSAYAIANNFSDSHNTKVAFLMSKEIVDSKVFNEEKSNYSQSEFESFYYENSIKKVFEIAFKDIQTDTISSEALNKMNNKIFEGEVYSVPSKDNSTLLSVIPLSNPITKTVVAAIILQADNNVLKKQNDFFVLIFSIGSILGLLAIVFIYREFSLKHKFLSLSLKTQNILDTQKSIVIITDALEIIDVNKKFLEFFDYNSLEDFKDKYECICELFIEDDNYFHNGKILEKKSWIEFLENLSSKDRVVLINDMNGVGHSFSIAYSNYQESQFIVTFTDISGTIEEQIVLENKIVKDKLTGAYNREFFEKKVIKIAQDNQAQGRFLGIIFVDIDHFKDINDTYGHGTGDTVLKELVKRVSESIRSSDYVIRWGGEEFLVLVSTKSLDELASKGEHLRSMIEHHYFQEVEHLTCSFGVTLYLNDEPITQALQRADKALYASKNTGRNKVTKI